ncbi:hypothetical protein [Arthrobacter rhombi]|uniref:hypothetical protein n=1 Tax=Arthrobacter rhombi TaxID=71253 RepID=UPI003FD26350
MDDLDFMKKSLKDMENDYLTDEIWADSPYKWVIEKSSGTKGAIARRLVKQWATLSGRILESHAVNNQRFLRSENTIYQVKSSTMWNTGKYRFQQFRKGPYDHAILIGIAPHDMHIWVVPKIVIDTHIVGSHGQHTGAGAAETDWYEVDPETVPNWLEEWGGTPRAARRILSQISEV